MNSTKKLITDLNVDSDVQRTFDKLKRSSYETLQHDLLSRYGRLYEVDMNANIYWPEGALDIIKAHGWTEWELLVRAQEKYDEK